VDDFVVCLGYKGEVIKDHFANYCMRNVDVVFDFARNRWRSCRKSEPWRVTCIDTGASSMTGGRL
jgi:glucose-1-phosphate cytidylyltransferase